MTGEPHRPRRRRELSAEEQALWRGIARSVRPLRRHARREVEDGETVVVAPARPTPKAKVVKTAAPARIAKPSGPPPLASLARREKQQIARGRTAIDARIDLHGMTQDDAHGTLGDFITASARAGRRCVLVITGKGLRRLGDDSSADAGIGVLRNAVPRWLNEAPNRARILAFAAAQPCDGGGGALYVLLRRQPRPAGR